MVSNLRFEVIAVSLLLALSVGAALPGLVAPSDDAVVGTAAAAHGSPGNYTVRPYDDAEASFASGQQRHDTCRPNDETPSDDDGNEGAEQDCDPYNGHMPGDTGASYLQFAYGGEAAEGTLDPFKFVVHEDTSGKFDMSQCEPANAAVAGIDRDNDNPGREYDTDLTEYFEDTYEKPHRITVDLADGTVRPTTHLNADDQIVAAVEDCYTNPSEPGWYQWHGWSNGTTEDGSTGRVELFTHYFPICECTDRQAAIEQLGPPPSKEGSGDGGGGATPTPTESGDGATPTPTETSARTPTPTRSGADGGTPTSAGNQAEGREATATPTSGGGGANATATATAGGGGGATATATGGDAGATPTVGSGPGFGVAVALVALLGAALLTRRRR